MTVMASVTSVVMPRLGPLLRHHSYPALEPTDALIGKTSKSYHSPSAELLCNISAQSFLDPPAMSPFAVTSRAIGNTPAAPARRLI